MNLEKRVKKLEEENKKLREENRFLKETIQALMKRIEELEGLVKEKNKPSFVKEEIMHTNHKSGQKEGHIGYTRHIPERIDNVKEHNPDKCPDCGGELSGVQEIRERVVTDIEIRVINTKHIFYRKYCKTEGKIVEEHIYDALPNARFGLKLMLLALILKLDSRIPSNKIVSIMDCVFGNKISDGEIYNILAQLKDAFGDYYQKLVIKIKDVLSKNIDETSWRIDGKNKWLWLFINKEVALYIVRDKRNNDVPFQVLGNQEGKTIGSDRFPAYDQLAKKAKNFQQICWSHILRDSKKLAENFSEGKYVHKRLKTVYNKAKEGEKKEKLLHWIDLIAKNRKRCRSTVVKKFVNSICKKHRDNLFRFVDNPEVDSTNNLAERGLRHAVVIRKISGGSRSDKGAETTCRLLSVLQTAKLQSNNHVDFMLNLLQNRK